MLQEYLDVMHIDVAETSLDMGCGTGSPPGRLLVDCVLPAGSSALISVPRLAEAARSLAREEGLADRVEFRAGDTRSLNLPDGGFDVVIAHTLVSHVESACGYQGSGAGR